MRPSRTALLALATTVVALAPRLVWQNAGLFHADSVALARSVEALVGERRWTADASPVAVLLAAPVAWLHGLMADAPGAAGAVTVLSALCGAAAAGLAVVFARPFVRTDAGAAASGLVVAALPTLLSTTTFASDHGLQVALLLAAGIAAERRRGLVTGLLLGLAIGTRVESATVLPALLVLLWRGDLPVALDRERGLHLRVPAADLVRRLAAVLGPALVIPLALHLAPASPGPDVWRGADEPATWLGPASVVLPDALDALRRTLTPLGLGLAGAGLVVLWRRDRARFAAVTTWFLVALLYVGNRTDVTPSHLICAAVVLAVPAGACLDAARGGLRVAAGAALIGLLAWMIMPLAPTLSARSRSCAPADFARRIANRTEPDSVIVAMDFAQHVERFAKRRVIGHPPLDGSAADSERLESSIDAIGDLIEAGTPVYVTSDAFAYDVPHPQLGMLDAGVGMWAESPTGGREALGRWGVAFFESVELRHVLKAPWDGWHGASLGSRKGASRSVSLYRALPATE